MHTYMEFSTSEKNMFCDVRDDDDSTEQAVEPHAPLSLNFIDSLPIKHNK